MSRSRLVGSLLTIGLIAGVIVLDAPMFFERTASLKSCPYPSTDYAMAPELSYQLAEFPTPEGGFRYYAHDLKTSGAPLVVLVAGYPDPHYFDAVIARLIVCKYRVLVFDLPGKSHTRLTRTPTAAVIVEQFQQFWDKNQLSTESNFLIVGTSISSPVAALMAAQWQAQKPRLAIVSALGMPREWTEWRHPLLVNTGRIPVLSDLLAPFVLPWLTRDNWKHGEILCPTHFPELFERQRQEFAGAYSAINYTELTRALVLTNQQPVYERLRGTSVPVRLINGDRDPFCDQIDKLRAVLPQIPPSLFIDDAAHIPFIEQPDQTVEKLKAVLQVVS
jgi:pimeloyl-ACP methyl ester carboxylesterase